MPTLPEGRHRLWRDDAPEVVCHLTVAPRRCYLPEAITRAGQAGARQFGIATQLYSLRRAGDQGIGDFTTLGMLAAAAGRQGAATIGIDPLHMLFPDQRERASPYHPSDRRFLDPIYLDVAESGAGMDFDTGADVDTGAGVAADTSGGAGADADLGLGENLGPEATRSLLRIEADRTGRASAADTIAYESVGSTAA